MSAAVWSWFWIALALAFLNVLYGMWLLGRFGMTAEAALEPRNASTGRRANAVASQRRGHAVRHLRFNEVRREAVAAALKDFGRLVRTDNPYPATSVAHATWASHYERVMHDQFSLEVARLEDDTLTQTP